MKPGYTARFVFAFLAYNGKFNSGIRATKIDFWNSLDATKENMTTFSLQCQDQTVKVESNIYHLDRLRSSLKSGYFEKLFTSGDFRKKNIPVLEIQPPNSEVFPAIVDIIYGKVLTDILNKDNYFPLLKAMNHFEMEIDLNIFSRFMDHNLTSFSLQETKIFELYNFIRKNSQFEYLLESVFNHFASDLTTLQNHTVLPSLPLDHLIRTINKVRLLNDKKRQKIVQMCTEWLCHDLENRLFHMANLAISIKSAFHTSTEENINLSKYWPECDIDEATKRKIILRCLFALLANKKLDPNKLDELISDKNLKFFSLRNEKIFKLYNFIKNDSKLDRHLESIFESLAENLTTLQNHELFLSLPHDHLIRIIKMVQKPNDEKKYKIIQIYTEWLCHDLENRLPHLANLVKSAKFLFHSSIERNADVRKCLPKCHIDDQAKRKIISEIFYALLTDNEQELNPKVLTDDESNYHSDDGYYSEEYRIRLQDPEEYTRIINRNDERDKLKKFLNNSDFYDITVRIGEKTYKLHRVILESKSGYFKNIFQVEYTEAVSKCYGIPTCPSKDKEYLLDDVIEPSIFDEVIQYIYFGNNNKYFLDEDDEPDEMVRVLKLFLPVEVISDEIILENCKRNLMNIHYKVSKDLVHQILKVTHGKPQHEDLYMLYLCQHMNSKWPEIYNLSHFLSISWTMMENMLKSPHFDLDSLDSDKILDICSKWLIHDLNNRFNFIPRIAQIINSLCMPDQDKYTATEATKLNNCSQQVVRDKLWESLSSLSYTISSKNSSNKTSIKLEEIPVFVASRNEETIDIMNVNLDEIATLQFPGANVPTGYNMSAAMIHEDLFVIFCSAWKTCFFEVYNLSLKKRFSLAMDSRLENSEHENFALLNCNNKIHFCSTKGRIMKYSMQMNRWEMISNNDESHKKGLRFASDGETIYRMYSVIEFENTYYRVRCAVETYNFDTKLWISIPNLPMVNDPFLYHTRFTVVNDHDLAISSHDSVIIYNRNSNRWITYKLPDGIKSIDITIFIQCEDRMLLLVRNELYHFSPTNSTKNWKKIFPLKNNQSETKMENLRYRYITTVHRPRFCNK